MRPTLTRIARVAKTLFGTPYADVSLFQGADLWRASSARLESTTDDPASELTRQSDGALWIEDLSLDARFSAHPTVTDGAKLRFYAGAPIALETGERVGVLAVYGLSPRALDQGLCDRLSDLADLVGHECDRVLAHAERLALLQELQRQEDRLEIAVNDANLCIFEIDFIKQSIVKSGVGDEDFDSPLTFDMLANGKYEHIHPEDRARIYEAVQQNYALGDYSRNEWRANRKDGREVWMLSSGRMYRDEAGNPTRVVGSLQNITERRAGVRALEEAKTAAEAANAAKSAFLATMSHEIRTPLNGVLGMAQAMAAGDLSDVQRERLDVVRQSGESLLAILNDLLDFSKIEAGKLELEEIEFDLAEIARGAYAAFTALANKKGLSFRLDIESAHGLYLGDPTRVRQILYNLISNALKFTDEGEISVTGDYDGARLLLEVSDTGIGMSHETVDGLFAKFTQADAATTRKFGGTGLGLAICKELALLMGGEVSARSVVGEGSTFRVALPMTRLGDAKADSALAVVEGPPQALSMRVLAAEDNIVNRLVLKTLLHQIGIEPTIVENGALALEAYRRELWDLVLMDVQMPVMDGPTAVRAIRAFEIEAGRPRTPIIALTANAMSHQVAEYAAAGMDGHLAKPIETAKLFAVLSSVFEADENEEALRA